MVAERSKPQRKGSRLQRHASATRLKLMNAARAVFAEKGLDLARIDAITERADVGKGSFYYHFNSKEELIGELIKEMLAELVRVIDGKCAGITDLKDLLDALIGAHITFFSNRWEDFVLFFQGRTDLTLQDSYQGIETPFLEYLARIEELVASVIKFQLPQPALRRIGCAIAGFVSGYYSFAVIASDEDVDDTFRPLREAIVTTLARFIQEAAPPGEPAKEHSEQK